MNTPSPSPLPSDQFELLRGLDGCTLADAIETFDVRLRNEGFVHGGTSCMFPDLPPLVGYAATIRVRGASPPMGSPRERYIERTDWWDHVLAMPAPRVLVIEDASSQPGLGALTDELHLNLFHALGCIGVVTNGAVRDLPAVRALGMPLFAGGVSVSHAYAHIVEIGAPVKIDGLTIHPGDVIHGDLHGVQTVPASLVPQLATAAAKVVERRRALIARCHQPHATIEQLRAAFSAARL